MKDLLTTVNTAFFKMYTGNECSDGNRKRI